MNLSYLYFKQLSKLCLRTLYWAKLIFLLNFSVLAINLLIGILGYGFAQYQGSIGTVGFFLSGNEVSGVLIILNCVMLDFIYHRQKKFYLLISFFLIILSLMKATKVAIFGTLLLVVLIPYFYGIVKRKNFIFSSLRYLFIICLLSPVFFFLVKAGLDQSGLIGRLKYFYNNYDLLTFLFSSRNLYASIAIEIYTDTFSFLEMLFGIGLGRFSQIFYMPNYGYRHTIEIDFFDFLMYYGIVGVIIIFSIWILFIHNSFFRLKNSNNSYSVPAFVGTSMLILISFTGGHIMYSGLVGIFVGLINGLVHLKEESILQTNQ